MSPLAVVARSEGGPAGKGPGKSSWEKVQSKELGKERERSFVKEQVREKVLKEQVREKVLKEQVREKALLREQGKERGVSKEQGREREKALFLKELVLKEQGREKAILKEVGKEKAAVLGKEKALVEEQEKEKAVLKEPATSSAEREKEQSLLKEQQVTIHEAGGTLSGEKLKEKEKERAKELSGASQAKEGVSTPHCLYSWPSIPFLLQSRTRHKTGSRTGHTTPQHHLLPGL